MKLQLPANVTRTIGKVKLTGKKYSPEILLGVGIVSGVAACVCACKATVKAADVMDNHKERIDVVKEAKALHDSGEYEEGELAEQFDDNAYKVNIFREYSKTALTMAKVYAPAVVLGVISIAAILTSHGIMKKRELAAVATSAAIREAFDAYRGRVVKELGTDMDEHFMYDTEKRTYESEVTDPETGKSKKVKDKLNVRTKASAYSRIFDEANDNFEKSGMQNYDKIRCDLLYLANKQVRDGYIFLNDVYKRLGFPISAEGQRAGWIWNPDDPINSLINFTGIGDLYFSSRGDLMIDEATIDDSWKALRNNYERSIIIDFDNLRDDILEDLPRVNPKVTAI